MNMESFSLNKNAALVFVWNLVQGEPKSSLECQGSFQNTSMKLYLRNIKGKQTTPNPKIKVLSSRGKKLWVRIENALSRWLILACLKSYRHFWKETHALLLMLTLYSRFQVYCTVETADSLWLERQRHILWKVLAISHPRNTLILFVRGKAKKNRVPGIE
jgi:hypothetical protein